MDAHAHGNFSSYITGFVLSIILTLLSYLLTVEHILTGTLLMLTISGLGTLQAVAQLILFLNLF